MESAGRSLTTRERVILHEVVTAHIESGEPVGSRTLSRLESLSLSAATIRNVMADLADSGYLSQPHASAGRIPTERAYRDFAAFVPMRSLPDADRRRIVTRMRSAESIEDRISAASAILTEFTHNVGIAAALPLSSQELDHIELVSLPGRQVMMIVATRGQFVRNRVIALDRALSQDDLNILRNYVNRNFAGWTLRSARTELLRRIAEERIRYDEILGRLTSLCQNGLFADSDPQLAMDGASWLLGFDLQLTRERMHELFRALEQKEQVVALLNRFLEDSGRLGVHIGLEGANPALRGLALIGLTVNLPAGVQARVAVLGPMRMQYDRVMSAVHQIGQAFHGDA